VVVVATVAVVRADEPQWFSACASGERVPNVGANDAFRLPGQFHDSAHLSVAYSVTPGYNAACAASGFFNDDVATTGWSYLQIDTNAQLDSTTQSYAAGYLEGFLTPQRNFQSYINGYSATFGQTNGTCPQKAYAWVAKQNAWIEAQVAANATSPYWQQVQFVYDQLQGMVDGYAAAATLGQNMPANVMQMVNMLAEVGDIMLATDYDLRDQLDPIKMNDFQKAARTMMLNSHCSALVRVLPDGSDLFAAHTTWSGYANMLRTYKTYKLPLLGSQSVGVQFSSYPGLLSSVDDFYQTDAKLMVIETTNNIANMTLYDQVVYQSVPTFVRTVVANRMANSGALWATVYSENNSGTYNNQWMIVDTKQFTPFQQPGAGTLWIASQIPGRVESIDATAVLNARGFWPSYNIPYFQDLWYALGYGTLVQQYGADGEYLWSYNNSFRALIFARDAPNVHGVEDMQNIMQENNWQTDPLSKNCSELAICARMDLTAGPLGPADPSGAIDAKISSYQMMSTSALYVLAKSGPTTQNQAPFQWSVTPWANNSHLGQPDTFNFAWQLFSVSQPPKANTEDAEVEEEPRESPAIALE
jgi:hypothetical protein